MRILNTIKVAASVLILLAIILTIGLYSKKILDSDSTYLEKRISAVEAITIGEKWDEASSEIQKVHNEWDSTKNTWAMLIDHSEIDNIEETLHRMTAYISTREKNEAVAEAAILKLFIRHIPEKEALRLDNIF